MAPLVHDHPGGGRHGHAAVTGPDADTRHLAAALVLIVGFMIAEVVAGVLAGSLALLTDAAHMVTDAGALGLGIVATRLAARPPSGGYTYGLKRAEVLSAQANGVALVVIGGFIVVEAVHRLARPVAVDGRAVVAVAACGIAVNLVATWEVARANRASLNIEGTYQHILTDLYAFAGTLVAGVAIVATGFERADPIVSLLVAALMGRAAWGLVGRAGRALMEAAPGGLVPDEIGNALASHPHVANVHDLHVWEITSGFPALSAHILVHPGDDCHAIRLELEQSLQERFGIEHTTLQVDHESENRVRWTQAPLPARQRRR
ncbi:MAG TPA: cation diffusion facilitator family transporter [Candidatus Dormibacteraeota bacterium]|nr:cation diffusion facilitator family transporter [Candidatus Dormibacteraeota bacterium]